MISRSASSSRASSADAPVLVDDCVDAGQPVAAPHDGDAAAAARVVTTPGSVEARRMTSGSTISSGCAPRRDGGRGSRRQPWPSRARVPAAPPAPPSRTARSASSAGRTPDRRARRARASAGTPACVLDTGRSSAAIRAPISACVCATASQSGSGGTSSAARSCRSNSLPTCGPLPCVRTSRPLRAAAAAQSPPGANSLAAPPQCRVRRAA